MKDSTTLKLLKDAKNLIVNVGFTQGQFKSHHSNNFGVITGYCALGALLECSKKAGYATSFGSAAEVLLECVPSEYASVGTFNDHTSKDEVLALFDKAIAIAEERLKA